MNDLKVVGMDDGSVDSMVEMTAEGWVVLKVVELV